MKRIKQFSLLCIILLSVFLLGSCNKGTSLLSPSNIEVDINNKLSWDKVAEARSYVINVKGENDFNDEYTTRKNYYSLSSLTEGDYIITLRSVGDLEGKVTSDWSEVFEFHRDYESGCTYQLINNGTAYEVTSGRNTKGNVYIDSVYRGKPVVSIKDKAFRNNTLIESIELGDSITSIGANAFYNCSKLTSIKLPSKLNYVGEAAFQSCKALEYVQIDSKDLLELPIGAFKYCYNLKKVVLPDTLEKIGDSAFFNTGLENVELPKNLTTIGESSFASNDNLIEVKINSNLNSIATQAFYKCKALTNVTFNSNSKLESIQDFAFSECDSLEKINLPESLLTISDKVFLNDTKLSNVTIPDTVRSIGAKCFDNTKLYNSQKNNSNQIIYADKWVVDYINNENFKLNEIDSQTFADGTIGIAAEVFYGQNDLDRIELQESIRYISQFAFANSNKIYILNTFGVEYIGEAAFSNCVCLSNLNLNDGLVEIGSYAFSGCSELRKKNTTGSSSGSDIENDLLIPDTVVKIGTSAFENSGFFETPDAYNIVYAGKWVVGCFGMPSEVSLKESVVGICDYAFYKNEYLTDIKGLSNVKYIGYGAFYGCSSLSSVTLNPNIKEIEDFTFYKCSGLVSVSLPRSLTRIGKKAFAQCSSLQNIDLSRTNVTTIEDSAFNGCQALTYAKFNDKIESIGQAAFNGCTSLKSIYLPDSLTSLGERAFNNCTSLSTLELGSGLTEIPTKAFASTSITSLVIPSNIKTIDKYAFFKCSSLEELELEEGLENIGSYAFYGNSKLVSLVLPDSVKIISNFAFKGCTGLTSILLKDSISSIVQHAFFGCKNLTFYTNCKELPSDWNKLFNSSYRPMIFGCELSETNDYITSLTINENTFMYFNEKTIAFDPERADYRFVYWSGLIKDENGNEVLKEFTTNEIYKLPVGTVLTAVWEKLS